MIDFEEIYDAFYQLPEYQLGNPRPDIQYSFPLLREIDGTLYVFFMIYLYGEHYPNRFFLYNTETKKAESWSYAETMSRFGIREFPVEPPVGEPHGEDEDIRQLYWDSIREDGTLDKEAFRLYLNTVIVKECPLEGKHYWAFAEWDDENGF